MDQLTFDLLQAYARNKFDWGTADAGEPDIQAKALAFLALSAPECKAFASHPHFTKIIVISSQEYDQTNLCNDIDDNVMGVVNSISRSVAFVTGGKS